MPLIVDSAQMPQKLCKNSKKRDTVPTNVSFFAKLLLFPSKIPKNEERIIYFKTITQSRVCKIMKQAESHINGSVLLYATLCLPY